MNSTLFKAFLIGALLSEVLAANTSADNKTASLPEKCPKTQCLVGILMQVSSIVKLQFSVPSLKFIVGLVNVD